MQDIGYPQGSVNQLNAINAHDVIVGTMSVSTGTRGFQWSPAGGYAEIGTLAGDYSFATDINSRGDVVGHSTVQAGGTDLHAVLRRPGLAPLDLGTLGGSQSFATGINDRGVVVGSTFDATGQPRAFRWTAQTGMQDIGAPGIANGALDVTDAGVVAGDFQPGDGTIRTYRQTEKAFVDIGLFEGGSFMAPVALSSAGHIALAATTRTGALVPLINYRGTLRRLPPLPGGRYPGVMDVNRCGHAVGNSYTSAGTQHAVLWLSPCP